MASSTVDEWKNCLVLVAFQAGCKMECEVSEERMHRYRYLVALRAGLY